MVITSISGPMSVSRSINRPTATAAPHASRTAAFRLSLRRVCAASETASSIFASEVMPANSTEIKKKNANRRPNGICWNTRGRVMNSSLGPEAGSRPNANTLGRMAKPASIAAQVSSTAVMQDE